MTSPKIALALICKGTDDEAHALAQCLSLTAPYVDGIFVTITQPNSKVTEVCQLYKAHVSQFEWCNDFSKARNFNFSQVPKDYEYILWLDADDAVRGLEQLKDIIKEHPADAYSFFYMYAFDENKNPTVVHAKTQVVKNDGCVTWVGRLHEDFRENRQLTRYHIDGIERIHLSNPKRYEQAAHRNLEIALAQLADEPDDPRSYWNVGNSYVGTEQYREAFENLIKFLSMSKSEDEKYIAHLRLSEVLWTIGKNDDAILHAQTAVGIKPNFPDAYFTLGSLYSQMNLLQKAAEMYLTGLPKPRPYHKIIVYNPRDYDYVPMMELAKVYFKLARPDFALPLLEGCAKIYPNDQQVKDLIKVIKKEVVKFDKVVQLIKRLSKIEDKEKLRRELDKIPDEFKSHPGICNLRNINFLKTESSGKDLVIYCGYTQEEWTPDTIKAKGIGGSEEAVYHLSNLLTEKGWNVTVYNNCGHKTQKFGNVTYAPYWTWNYKDKQDVVVLWRVPIYLDFEINAPKIYLDLHDVIQPAELTPSRLERVTKILVKSKFHRSLFPEAPDNKFVVIPNGIDPTQFDQPTRNPKLILNTSAPDRSITALAKIFPKIKEAVPDAECVWAYGWGTFDAAYSDDQAMMDWKASVQKAVKDAGIKEVGRVNHDEIARLSLTANVWAYPSGFAEIDCISLSKAMAAGTIPVATDFSAVGEKAGHGGFFFHSNLTNDTWFLPGQTDFACTDETLLDQMADKIIDLLKNPPSEETRLIMRQWAKKTFDWTVIANQWNELLIA